MKSELCCEILYLRSTGAHTLLSKCSQQATPQNFSYSQVWGLTEWNQSYAAQHSGETIRFKYLDLSSGKFVNSYLANTDSSWFGGEFEIHGNNKWSELWKKLFYLALFLVLDVLKWPVSYWNLRGSFQKFCTLYVFSLKMNLFYKIHLQAFNLISTVLYHSGPTFGQVLYSCQDAFVFDASDYSGHLIRHLLDASEASPMEWFLQFWEQVKVWWAHVRTVRRVGMYVRHVAVRYRAKGGHRRRTWRTFFGESLDAKHLAETLLDMFASCAISSHDLHRSSSNSVLTITTDVSSVAVTGRPLLGLSWTLSRPSRKRDAHRDTVLLSTTLSPQTSCKGLWISVGVFPRKVSILMYDRWSLLEIWLQSLFSSISRLRFAEQGSRSLLIRTHPTGRASVVCRTFEMTLVAIIGYNNRILDIVKHNGIPLRSIERLRCLVWVYIR